MRRSATPTRLAAGAILVGFVLAILLMHLAHAGLGFGSTAVHAASSTSAETTAEMPLVSSGPAAVTASMGSMPSAASGSPSGPMAPMSDLECDMLSALCVFGFVAFLLLVGWPAPSAQGGAASKPSRSLPTSGERRWLVRPPSLTALGISRI